MWCQHAVALAWANMGCQPISVRQVADLAWGLGGDQRGGVPSCLGAWDGKGF